MNANRDIANSGSWMSLIRRGAALFAGLGGVLGGIAGTIDWPVVGTLFGAGGAPWPAPWLGSLMRRH